MIRKIHTATALGLCLALGTLTGAAQVEETQLSKENLEKQLKIKISVVETLGFHPKLVAAVRAQNSSGLSMQTIKDRDQSWTGGGEDLFRQMMENSEISNVLAELVGPNDAYTEAFLTDAQGANVAMYPATSDYWQGDEDKWLLSFNGAQGQTFIGDIEFDQSTNTEQVQVSAPVIDMRSNETLGVLVVGVNVSYLKSIAQ